MPVNHKALGVVFLCLLLVGVWLTYGIFTKKFVDYDRVTLETSTLGLQLPERADVKIRGVIVGEVLGFDTGAEGAEVTLGLFPDQVARSPPTSPARSSPRRCSARSTSPSRCPTEPSRDHIEAGATIERTQVAIEVEKVLNDLYPLLRAVQPAEINQTLNAIATALEGRGELIGENFETVDAYLKRLNPEIPAIVEDLRLTAKVSTTYADVMPQIAEILRNTIKTTGTLEDREQQLQAFFRDLSTFSDDARVFLDQNGDNIIRLGQLGAAQLRVLAKYAPGVPLPDGRHRQGRQAAGGGLPRLHAAHRAGDAAQPAARLQRGRRAPAR